MAFSNHALDNGRIFRSGINRAFAEIITGDEECRVEAKLLQDIQQFACVEVWSVIVGQGDDVVFYAIIDVVGI